PPGPTTERLRADADHDARPALRRAEGFELPLRLRRALLAAEADFLELLRKFLRDKVEDLLRCRGSGGVLDAGVDVLGVLAEDHHVYLLRVFHRGGHAAKPAHGPQAAVLIAAH